MKRYVSDHFVSDQFEQSILEHNVHEQFKSLFNYVVPFCIDFELYAKRYQFELPMQNSTM